MAKVFDEAGDVVDASDDVVLNDLMQAPILEALPTDVPIYYVIALPAVDGKRRLALVMPKVVATVKALQAMVTSLGKRIDDIALTPGPQGEPGTAGATGSQGERGLTGQTGAQGIPGAKGDAGSAGAKGDTGAQGLPGTQGIKGDKGDSGTTGTKGDTGQQGIQGLTGAKGDIGLTGPKGDTGATGAKGDAGTPTRVERYTTFSTDSSGIVTITFSTPFTTLPDCEIVESWTSANPPQQIVGSVTEVTLAGCKAQVMLSQGTLLIGAAPFTKAGAGIKPIVRAIGK